MADKPKKWTPKAKGEPEKPAEKERGIPPDPARVERQKRMYDHAGSKSNG